MPERPEHGGIRLAHLDPGAVAEVPVLVGDDRQLEQRADEVAVAALPVQHREVVLDVGAAQALLFVEQEDGLRQAHADVARLARVRLATDVTGEGHYAAVAVPGRYCCQTCGIVGVARWMKRTGAGARGCRFKWSPDLLEQAVSLAQVARCAGGDDVLPDRLTAPRARHDMVEREPAARAPQ